jgi:hypothetical protein
MVVVAADFIELYDTTHWGRGGREEEERRQAGGGEKRGKVSWGAGPQKMVVAVVGRKERNPLPGNKIHFLKILELHDISYPQ